MGKTIIFLLVILNFSCSNTNDIPVVAACGVENPIEDLDWLRAEINRREENPSPEMQYCFITIEEYENQTVFVYNDCNPRIDKIIPILNCDGAILNSQESFENLGDFISRTIIWQPNNFTCIIDRSLFR